MQELSRKITVRACSYRNSAEVIFHFIDTFLDNRDSLSLRTYPPARMMGTWHERVVGSCGFLVFGCASWPAPWWHLPAVWAWLGGKAARRRRARSAWTAARASRTPIRWWRKS